MRNAPKPPKPLTRFCAIMQKAPLAEGCTFICKSLEGEDRSLNQYPSAEENEPEENLDSESEFEGPEGDLYTMFLKRRRARRNAEKRKARAERALNKTESIPKHQTKSKHYYDLDESEPEEDLDSLSEFEGPENDMRTIVQKAKRAEINARSSPSMRTTSRMCNSLLPRTTRYRCFVMEWNMSDGLNIFGVGVKTSIGFLDGFE